MDLFKRQKSNGTSSNGRNKKSSATTISHDNHQDAFKTATEYKSTTVRHAPIFSATATNLKNATHKFVHAKNPKCHKVDDVTNSDMTFRDTNKPSTSGTCGFRTARCASTSSSPISPLLCDSPLDMLPSSSSITPSSASTKAASETVTSSSDCHAKKTRKRKRSLCEKEPEIGYEPPSSKRTQVHGVYISPNSVEDYIESTLDRHSSSECLSTVTEYDIVSDDIPDSPDSYAHHNNNDDHDDDDVDDDNDAVNSDATDSTTKTEIYAQHVQSIDTTKTTYQGERTPSQRLQKKSTDLSCYVSEPYIDCMTPAAETEATRQCPLPALSWANAEDVWHLMCKKDAQATSLRHATMLDRHPSLQSRMRAILLDWLIEVCEVYKLHRETYYLAVDYLDRYLSAQLNIPKTHLQLIGITCLFVAAKVEEIYPPKIGEFAYVTDGACQEHDILQTEILLLQALEWQISPVTPMGWLGVYMQLNVNNRTPASFTTTAAAERRRRRKSESLKPGTKPTDDAFIYPQFSGMEFVHTAQLLDLCTMDVCFSQFSYSIIAAAAMSHTFSRDTAMRCSGYEWCTLQECAEWMAPFFRIVCKESRYLHLTEESVQLSSKFGLGHICPNIVTDDSHIIQTHTTTMDMFDRVCLQLAEDQAVRTKIKQEASPATGLICPEGLLTPPSSSRKPPEDDEYVEQTTAIVAAINKKNNLN